MPHYPGLVQWLALADAKQCDYIVECCLAQLTASGASNGTLLIREILASPTLSPTMEGLRSETMIKVMRLMAGLTLNKVVINNIYLANLIDRAAIHLWIWIHILAQYRRNLFCIIITISLY